MDLSGIEVHLLSYWEKQGEETTDLLPEDGQPKPEKNRLHIDINAGGGRGLPPDVQRKMVDVEVLWLIGLGAEKLCPMDEDGEYWVVMEDIEGNEYCVQ